MAIFILNPVNFAFDLKGTMYTLYLNWTSAGPDLATKKKLRRGDRRTLNVYIISTFGVQDLVGVSSLPSNTQTELQTETEVELSSIVNF